MRVRMALVGIGCAIGLAVGGAGFSLGVIGFSPWPIAVAIAVREVYDDWSARRGTVTIERTDTIGTTPEKSLTQDDLAKRYAVAGKMLIARINTWFVFPEWFYLKLPVNDLPPVDYPVITVGVGYPGASPETVASNIATPLPVVSSKYRLVSFPPNVVIAVRPASGPTSSNPNGTGACAAVLVAASTATMRESRLFGMIRRLGRKQPPGLFAQLQREGIHGLFGLDR